MRESINRLLDWFRRDRLEREMAEELRFHREHAERDARAAGLEPAEAAYAAKRRFGNATMVAEDARDRWSLPRLEQLQQDVRYALRGLRRSPAFTATAVLTLSLGIGANVAMFGVVDQLMFKPYPYLRTPELVHRVYLRASYRGKPDWGYGGEYTRYLDMRRFTTSFTQLAGFAVQSHAVGVGENVRERRVATVSGSFWDFFDAKPVLGRFFGPTEDEPPRGAEVGVLSYNYWQSEFGGRDVLGERLQVGNMQVTIIGVAPRGFIGVSDPEPAMYVPITLYAGSNPSRQDRDSYYTRYNWGWMNTMVRRKPGVSVEAASADITQAFRRSWQIMAEQEPAVEPVELAKPNGVVGPMKSAAGPAARLESKTALWVTGVSMIVLLIACANVANLSLARALQRRREVAVRLALGVSRARLAGQMLIETLLLAAVGGAVGLLVAQWGSLAIQRVLIASPEAARPTVTDWRMLSIVFAVVLIAGLLAGLAPALVSGRGNLGPLLRGGVRGGMGDRSKVRGFLLVTQGALSVVLLIGAALFVKSLQHIRDYRMGYDAEPVLLVGTNMRGVTLDSVQRAALRRSLVENARATPGVEAAAWVSSVPMWSTSSTRFYVNGIDSVAKVGRFTYQTTTPEFFQTFGTRILRGRGFTDADAEGAPLVTIVSQSMAKALWPGRDAIGECIFMRQRDAACTTVIGIAEDIVQDQDQLTDPRRFQYYLPESQYRVGSTGYVMVKMRGEPEAQAEAVRQSLQRAMPGASYVTVRPMSSIIGATQRSWRLGANLFVAFGVLALVVAAVGLYGVIGYNVTQRMHEMGVRVALGAQGRDILALIVGQGARFAIAGVVVGSLLALLAGRWVEPLLFQQSARDPFVYLAVGGVMLLVALAASASPARRAARADPNASLRVE